MINEVKRFYVFCSNFSAYKSCNKRHFMCHRLKCRLWFMSEKGNSLNQVSVVYEVFKILRIWIVSYKVFRCFT